MADIDWDALRARIAAADLATANLLSPTDAEHDRVLEDRARRIARKIEAAPEDEIELAFFRAAGESFAIDSLGVSSVLASAQVEPVPRTPPVFRGVAAHRGDVLPVIDLGALLTGARSFVGDRLVLVLGFERAEIGIAIDEAERVGRVPLAAIARESLPSSLQNFAFVRGVHDGHRVVVDARALLLDPRTTL